MRSRRDELIKKKKKKKKKFYRRIEPRYISISTYATFNDRYRRFFLRKRNVVEDKNKKTKEIKKISLETLFNLIFKRLYLSF
jgi:hypothetical protein